MKNCKILVGPIAGDNGVNHNEGDIVALDDGTAAMFVWFGYVTIEEPTPIEPAALSPLRGGDLPAVPAPVPDPPSPSLPVPPSPIPPSPTLPTLVPELPTPNPETLTPDLEVKETSKSKKAAPLEL